MIVIRFRGFAAKAETEFGLPACCEHF